MKNTNCSTDDINDVLELIENNTLKKVNLDDVSVLYSIHDCLLETYQLLNILESFSNSIINSSGLSDIDILLDEVNNLKIGIEDMYNYQSSYFGELNNKFFNQ